MNGVDRSRDQFMIEQFNKAKIKQEDVLKSIYFHEVGHIYHNHYNSKKLKLNYSKKNMIYNNLFSKGFSR